jgi:hypothetical protein
MGSDGILRTELSGDLVNGIAETLDRDYKLFLDAATPDKPLRQIILFNQLGELSPGFRHYLTELNKDLRLGWTAYVHAPRPARVMGQFILKASGRKNIENFDHESEAIAWLLEHPNGN